MQVKPDLRINVCCATSDLLEALVPRPPSWRRQHATTHLLAHSTATDPGGIRCALAGKCRATTTRAAALGRRPLRLHGRPAPLQLHLHAPLPALHGPHLLRAGSHAAVAPASPPPPLRRHAPCTHDGMPRGLLRPHALCRIRILPCLPFLPCACAARALELSAQPSSKHAA